MSAFEPSPGLWPRESPRLTRSEAERNIYHSLRRSLPRGWYAWHSLKLRSEKTGKFGQADFIIADPNRPAILILEVKGGQIEQLDGRWVQNHVPLKIPPLDQGFSFLKKLIKRFKEHRVKPPTMGVATCFPDTFFLQQPTQDDIRGLVIGAQDLPHLGRILQDVMARAVPDPWRVGGPWVSLLHRLWGETWVSRLGLGARVRSDTEHRIQLDEEQIRRLDEIEENDHVLIKGAAGTGKTLLAREAALRQARQGRRVLLLCFTDALSKWLAETIHHDNITAAGVRNFAALSLGDDLNECIGPDPSQYWNTVSLRAAAKAFSSERDLWDAVIVDEGQDFSEGDWVLVKKCAGKTGRLWIFADEDQAFWSDRSISKTLEQEGFKIRLKKPYRCRAEIQNLADCYANRCEPDRELLNEGIQKSIIRIVTSSEQRLTKQVGKEINRLTNEGLEPHEIAVISVRGMGAKESIIHFEELGGRKAVPATDTDADSQIICDTFLRFKGLERPAVIVTDLRLVTDLYETRMHIAVSRAQSFLRIVGVETEIRKDLILARLLGV